MKKNVIGLAGALILYMAGIANATPYADIVDFSASGTYLGQTYSLVSDSNGNASSYFGEYIHIVDFDPVAASVESASLTIYYANANETTGPSSNPTKKEIYFISDSGLISQLGELTGVYDSPAWQFKTFDLSSYIAAVSGASWSIGFKFNETTNATDTFYLDKSTLFGEYTPASNGGDDREDIPSVPEPSTVILLGSGLLGLVYVGRKRSRK